MKRTIGIAMAAILMAAMFASNVNASTSHMRTISSDSANPDNDFKRFDTTPKAYDFNGDGIKEIVTHNDNRHVYVFDSQSGEILADLKTRYPSGWGARPLNSPEAAILDQGGSPHVVVVNSASIVTLFRYDGTWGGEHHFTKVWDKRTTYCYDNPGNDAKPVLYDLDGNGEMDILIQTEENGVYALRSGDGSVLWRKCIGGGNGEPAVADMDSDGVPDVVFASDGGVVTRINGHTGDTICDFWMGHLSKNVGPGAMPVGPTIAQVNNKGPLDIVVGVRDSHDRNNPDNNHAVLVALKGKWCTEMWSAQDPNGNPLTYTHPVVHDVDHDGRPDVLWADWNTEGHKPGNWERTGPANFYRYDNNGNMVWRTQLDTYWNNKDLALADVDSDGTLEILANGPGGQGDGIWYLNAKTGAKENFVSTHPWKVSRAPVIYDLYGWGTMQWIVPVEAATSSVSGGAIMIFDTGAPYHAPWPHPPGPGKLGGGSGGSGGTGGSGDFDAQFTVEDTENNWWVETYVDANEPVTKVVARVDGEPTRLQKTDWGSWAKSFHVSDGSEVRFVAHSSDGDRDRSKLFTWGSGGGSGGDTGGGDFDAQFTVHDTENNWWVETYVDANEPVTKVVARVNDEPTRLQKTDWGSWAKSFHVSDGSEVVFVAHSSDGDRDRSTSYTWGSGGSGGGSGSDFTASFTPTDNRDEWWVETSVDANKPLSKVEARHSDGSWRTLDKTDWGTWAKSFHVPEGAEVQFRASDGDSTVRSTWYTWS